MHAAFKLLESYDVAPKILAEGEDFFIDEWNGDSIGKDYKTIKVSR